MAKPVAVVDYSLDGLSGGLISSWLGVPSIAVKVADGSVFPGVASDEFSAVIHSGSSHSIMDDTSFIDGAIRFVLKCVEAGVPQMGICYGHQLLARATTGFHAVSKCRTLEIGWRTVSVLPQWPVESLSGDITVWSSHYDCVLELPPDSKVTATNSHTEIQAFVNMKMKLFGTQFHPEFDSERGNLSFLKDAELFRKNNIDLEEVLASAPGYFIGEQVFQSFLETFRQE
jgi:GMP synthase (glutamine-hydrolysing)